MAENDVFSYDPLPDASIYIRVLVLEHGNKEDPLRVTLLQESLDEVSVPYEAVSYWWGIPEKSFRITVRQGEEVGSLTITENLHNALVRFRSVSEDRTLWNDALCIDQSDVEEKAQQVRLMGRIYTEARKVLIYLGEPDGSTLQAFEMMDKVHTAFINTPDNDSRRSLQWTIDNGLPTVLQPEKWQPLKNFFRRTWFRRKWTIQECVLASRPVFFLGDWEKEWDYMAIVDAAINARGLAVLDHTTCDNIEAANELRQGLSQLHNISTLKKALINRIKYQLMDLVSLFTQSRASDPRDHLFALLDLASDASDSLLDPRYGEADTVLKICLDYARFFLRQKGNLEVLYRAGIHGQELLAPSWIPDWYGGHSKSFVYDHNSGLWDPLNHPAFYNVAPNTRPQFVDAALPTILGLKGTIIDTITDLANHRIADPGTKLDKDMLLDQKRWHLEDTDEIMSKLSNYPTGETLFDVQWRTLICNVTMDLQKAPDSYRTAYEAYRKIVLLDDDYLPEYYVTKQPFGLVIDNYNDNKVFGSTVSGYVGMFPQLARSGDKIAVLDGGEFPFVLRQNDEEDGENFELVGQCYVHGRMEEGQLDLNDSCFEKRTIFLGASFEGGVFQVDSDGGEHDGILRRKK